MRVCVCMYVYVCCMCVCSCVYCVYACVCHVCNACARMYARLLFVCVLCSSGVGSVVYSSVDGVGETEQVPLGVVGARPRHHDEKCSDGMSSVIYNLCA